MGVVEVKEKVEGRRTSQGADWRRTYSRVFQVLTTGPEVGPKIVRTSLPVAIGDFYSFGSEVDSATFCNLIEASCDERSGQSWTVNVSYGPIDPAVRPLNPLDEQPQVVWGWAQFQEAVIKDRNGDPIQNTAGQPLNPGLSRDQSRPVLILARNEANFDLALADAFRDTVNNAIWWGAAAGKVKVSNISARRVSNPDAGGFYWEVQYEFAFNRDKWTAKPLSQGYSQLNTGGTALEPIFIAGSPAQEPVPLDASGRALAVGGTPIYLEFEIYEESDFSLLNFDALYLLLTS